MRPDDGSEDAPILRLVALILHEATLRGATGVRMSRMPKRLLCEYEIAGAWQEVESPPTYLWRQIGNVLIGYAGCEYWSKGPKAGIISRQSLESRWLLTCEDQHQQILLQALAPHDMDEGEVITT